MTWAGKRQLIILGIILGIIVILGLIIIVPRLQKESTCFDGKQNGDELGVDCGGSCPRFCPFELNDTVLHWSRAFPVASNLYNIVAYIENQNIDAAVQNISYQFKLYDENNIFIAERKGRTFINPNKKSAIFETTVDVGNRVPKRVTFSFLEDPKWVRVDRRIMNTLEVLVQEKSLTGERSKPKLAVTLFNNSLYDIFDLDVVVLLYNEEGNVTAVSKTYIEKLDRNSSQKSIFTWPYSLTDRVVNIEVIPRVNIFSIKF